MTRSLFAALEVYHDTTPRSPAMNMAIDEALLGNATVPSLRLYRWDHDALSFGYFGRYADVSAYESKRQLVRRWTGGGIVLHGDDLTYAIVIPRDDLSFSSAPMSIYATVHDAIRNALAASGKRAELAPGAGVADAGAAVRDRGYNGHCFANPVRADVLVNGRKVAGAAQRRTRAGLLQQGSIQHVDLAKDFETRFARELSTNCDTRKIDDEVLTRARKIAGQKYGTKSWLQKR